MTEYEQFCNRVRDMQSRIIEAFSALGRVVAPVISALVNISSTMRPNRKAEKALLRGNSSQWQWYVSEHKRRSENRANE